MRCNTCNATSDGKLTAIPFKRSRQFNVDPNQSHLLVCSDCGIYGQNQTPTEDILPGEIPNLESMWDEG